MDSTEDHIPPVDEPALNRLRTLLQETPEQIGPYRILERIGTGGMGEVYRAEQRTPIRREVALKLIKLGMDTKLVIARFEAERQALALMDHPHIAKVYDANTDESGRPYFVMEYVRGKPITQYADINHLSIQERLELFQQVCYAIQHAHQKGIIHRDVKPSNVLTSTQDGKPHAKVIDFGIAKATSQQLTDKTLYTLHDQFIGTPQYMSPEQAEGSLDIDTRTDVYSLGVLLYELLTGSPPFSMRELQAVAMDEIKKIIREVEPPKPSTRLSVGESTLPALAAQRRIEPKRLGMLVRGELDWIVMMALDKDRRRRYDTPNALAADIANFLTGQSVVAAPPSKLYLLRKFAKKNKSPIIAASALTGALTIGLAGTTWQWQRANRAAAEAIASRNDADKQRREAVRQRDSAELESYISRLTFAELALKNGNYPDARDNLSNCVESRRGWEWQLLNARANSVVVEIDHGYPDSAYRCVKLHPQSDLFVTAKQIWNESDDSRYSNLQLWDFNGKRLGNEIRCDGEINEIMLGPSGDFIAVFTKVFSELSIIRCGSAQLSNPSKIAEGVRDARWTADGQLNLLQREVRTRMQSHTRPTKSAL